MTGVPTMRAVLPQLSPRRPRMRLSTGVYIATALVFGVFLVSTIPGVRPNPGYNLLLDGFLNNIAYELSAVVCFVRARGATTYRASYLFLGVGLAIYGSGNVFWTIFVRTQDPEPFPSIADGLWLSFYPCALIALVLFVRGTVDDVPLSLWLDGLVGGLAVAGVAAALFNPIVAETGGSKAAVVTTLAHVVLDVLVLLVVTSVLALFNWRPPVGLWFVAAGMAMFSLADGVYLFSANNGTYQPGGLNDGIWVVATLVIAFAPGRRAMASANTALPSWVRVGFPVVATLAALATLIYDHSNQLNFAAILLCAATVVAALGRLIVTFREVASLADSHTLAFTDELTGLGNRRAFYEEVSHRLGPDGAPGALLLLDLDRFKEVNDSLGHQAGDTLLRHVTSRLLASLASLESSEHEHRLIRLGGDEFATLLDGADEAAGISAARGLRDALEAPFSLDGVTVRLTASIGIALYPSQGGDVSTLLRRADRAMYEAKATKVGHRVYSDDLDAGHDEQRLRDLEDLRSAIVDRSLVVHYQPKLDARSGAVVGVEALVRWEHPTRGLLLPGDFLPLVEDAGLMRDLTDAVLEVSLDQVRVWRAAGRHLNVAVNLSASSLVDAELPARVRGLLSVRRLASDALELEITEDFLMGDRERARDILAELRHAGIRVSVDDFGTGYSSLAYLRELPIDELKLDRSFVKPMADDPRAAAIVRSTIDLAHALGMTMVAEGVESEGAARQLAAYQCDKVQGFYYSPALEPADLERWIDARTEAEDLSAGRHNAPVGPRC